MTLSSQNPHALGADVTGEAGRTLSQSWSIGELMRQPIPLLEREEVESCDLPTSAFLADPLFANTASRRCFLEDVRILACRGNITHSRELLPALSLSSQTGVPVAVFACEFSSDVIKDLVANRLAGTATVVALRAEPEDIDDIAAQTSATICSPSQLRSGWVDDSTWGRCDNLIASETGSSLGNLAPTSH